MPVRTIWARSGKRSALVSSGPYGGAPNHCVRQPLCRLRERGVKKVRLENPARGNRAARPESRSPPAVESLGDCRSGAGITSSNLGQL